MTGNRRRACLLAIVLLASTTLVGCGGTDTSSSTPAICSSVAALKSSLTGLKDVRLDDQTLASLEDKLGKVKSDVDQVARDAKSQYSSELDSLKQAATALTASLGAAQADPSAVTVAAVGAAVRVLGTSLTALQEAVTSTC